MRVQQLDPFVRIAVRLKLHALPAQIGLLEGGLELILFLRKLENLHGRDIFKPELLLEMLGPKVFFRFTLTRKRGQQEEHDDQKDDPDGNLLEVTVHNVLNHPMLSEM